MTKPLILNVVSGKGGSGKSLIVAMLGRLLAQEGTTVLLVDFDVFVRGLTHFFYLFKGERRRITAGATVADVFGLSHRPVPSEGLAKERFFEVDIIPAVAEIEEELMYGLDLRDVEVRVDKLFQTLRSLPYEIILVDNRSGMDHLILSCCGAADISISVSEADPVSRTTNDNLLRHLKTASTKKVYTILNKVRYLRTLDDYRRAMEQIRSDYEVMGQIPFDVDLFESFGKADFWDTSNSTRFALGVAEAWNRLARREEITTLIDLDRFPQRRIWAVSSRGSMFMNKFERLSVTLGFLFLSSYFVVRMLQSAVRFDLLSLLLLYGAILTISPFLFRLLRPLLFKEREHGENRA